MPLTEQESTLDGRKNQMVNLKCIPLSYDILFFRPPSGEDSRIYHLCTQEVIEKYQQAIAGTVVNDKCDVCMEVIENAKSYSILLKLDNWSRG